jgi:hypothetical protein
MWHVRRDRNIVKNQRIFQILAVFLAALSAYFYWQANSDGAFFFLVTSACSYFLSIRFEAKERLARESKNSRREEP